MTVVEATKCANSAQTWDLVVEDSAGQQFDVEIWNTHDVDVWWHEGWRYVVEQGLGKRWDGNVVLHSTKDFTVRKPGDVVDILAMSDTHIGRERRPEDSGAPYRTARQFLASVGYAKRYDVDAVLHGGDFFDDNPTQEDLAITRRGFEILASNRIPFYHVHGNHGVAVAKDVLSEFDREHVSHLDMEGESIGGSIEAFGIDYTSPGDVSTIVSESSASRSEKYSILVMHQELAPVRPDADISMNTLTSSLEIEFDYILSGHLHDPDEGSWGRTKIQYLGSTAAISRNNSATDRSVWLLRFGRDGTSLDRLPAL